MSSKRRRRQAQRAAQVRMASAQRLTARASAPLWGMTKIGLPPLATNKKLLFF
jgi:hypothetical protein